MFVTIGTNPDLTSPIGDAEQKGFRLHQMRLLVNPISGSIAGAGGVLFVLLFILKIMLVEIREDEVTFLLVFTLMIPMYLLILPLISLVGTLIDNSHPGKVKESVIHSCKYSVIGSLVFTFFLVLSIFLAIEADWGHFTEELGIDLPDMLLIVLISNLASTSIGGIINGYRISGDVLTSVDLDAYRGYILDRRRRFYGVASGATVGNKKLVISALVIITVIGFSMILIPEETGLYEYPPSELSEREYEEFEAPKSTPQLMFNTLQALDVNNCIDKSSSWHSGESNSAKEERCHDLFDSAKETITLTLLSLLAMNSFGYLHLKKMNEGITQLQDSILENESR